MYYSIRCASPAPVPALLAQLLAFQSMFHSTVGMIFPAFRSLPHFSPLPRREPNFPHVVFERPGGCKGLKLQALQNPAHR